MRLLKEWVKLTITMKLAIIFWIAQSGIMELFKSKVGNELPIKFSFDGKVYNWISYDGNAALYGILMLGCIHLAALALQISISRKFKYNPWIEF
jgi:hypothetical protein